MSLNPKDALSQLCHICIKSSPFDDLKQGELDLFTQAFSNPDIDTLERPDLLPVPDPIPDEDFPEPEPEPEPVKIEEGENTKDDPDDEAADHGEEELLPVEDASFSAPLDFFPGLFPLADLAPAPRPFPKNSSKPFPWNTPLNSNASSTWKWKAASGKPD